MRILPYTAGLAWLSAWLAGTTVVATVQDEAPRSAVATAPAGRSVGLEVGDPAPPVAAVEWLNGKPVAPDQPGEPAVVVLVFWASWSGPSRGALPELIRLNDAYSVRGVAVAGVTQEPAEEVREFLGKFEPPVTFPIALDLSGETTRTYCRAVGVDFVPYAFVIGADRSIAWHGHPLQPELARIVEELLSGTYDQAAARELVRQAQSINQLEALFRDACASGSWRTALLALDGLLKKDVPRQRLLRYKLTILLGELDDLEQARVLADALVRDYASDARFLNSAAWDILTEPRLYERDPELGLRLAQAAYRAARGQDAAVADTYARALHLIGRLDLAISVQELAVARSSPDQRAEHQRRLEFYRRCRALQAQVNSGLR